MWSSSSPCIVCWCRVVSRLCVCSLPFKDVRWLVRVRSTVSVPCFGAVVCFGVPCCVLLCFAVLRRAVLRCALMRPALSGRAVPCHAVVCLVFGSALLCGAALCRAVLCRGVGCLVALRCTAVRYPRTQLTPHNPQGTRPHQGTKQTTPEVHARRDALPQPGPDTARTTPGRAHRPPLHAQAGRVHPRWRKGIHPHTEPPRTPHNPPSHPNHQAKSPATARATTQTHGRQKGKGDTGATPRTGDDKEAEGQDGRGPNTAEGTTPPHRTKASTPLGTGTARGHVTKAQASRDGNPADTLLTNQAERHNRTPGPQTQRAAPRLTMPLCQQPATQPQPAAHTTKPSV